MAQRTEKEETEFKVVPDTISVCVICGVAGNAANNNRCKNCFNANTAAVSSSSVAGKGINHAFVEKSFRSNSSSRPIPLDPLQTRRDLKVESSTPPDPATPIKREINRCSGCRRKVGLTGFRCRCGELFCADHRYSDRHYCSYDYKAVGRKAIARENPVVKAAKIVKI